MSLRPSVSLVSKKLLEFCHDRLDSTRTQKSGTRLQDRVVSEVGN